MLQADPRILLLGVYLPYITTSCIADGLFGSMTSHGHLLVLVTACLNDLFGSTARRGYGASGSSMISRQTDRWKTLVLMDILAASRLLRMRTAFLSPTDCQHNGIQAHGEKTS